MLVIIVFVIVIDYEIGIVNYKVFICFFVIYFIDLDISEF